MSVLPHWKLFNFFKLELINWKINKLIETLKEKFKDLSHEHKIAEETDPPPVEELEDIYRANGCLI